MTEAMEVTDRGTEKDSVTEEAMEMKGLEADEVLVTEGHGQTGHRERCTRQYALNAALNAKCRSSQQKASQCIAGNASERRDNSSPAGAQ